ncbi:MAG TPA: hypothetical protein V6D00_02310 [Pantanalinema sp.]
MRRSLLSFSIGVGLLALGCQQAQTAPPTPAPTPAAQPAKSAVRMEVLGSASYERLDVRVHELGPGGRGLIASGSYAPAQVPAAFALDSLMPGRIYQVTAIARDGDVTIASSSASVDVGTRTLVATQSLALFVPYRVDTVAGGGSSGGYTDGASSSARFNAPSGLASDASGSLYIADLGNRLIRKMDASGSVTTLAGIPRSQSSPVNPGEAIPAQAFLEPCSVAIGTDGRILVADQGRNQIRAITRIGVVGDFAGQLGFTSFASGSAQTAIFNKPAAVTVLPNGTVVVADTENHLIRGVSLTGQVVELAGMYVPYSTGGYIDAEGAQAAFKQPAGLVADRAGNLYVADTGNHCIRKLTPQGRVTTFAGRAGSAGHADGDAHAAQFNSPTGLAWDAHGQLFVADSGNHCVRMISSDGRVVTAAGRPGVAGFSDGRTVSRMRDPYGIAVAANGDVFVSDRGNHALRRLR